MMQELKDRFSTRPSVQLTAPLLRRLIWWVIALVWAPFAALPALAGMVPAVTAAIEDPLNIPPVLMGLAMVISTLSGATALLVRIDRELSASPDKPLPRPWLMSISHMCSAWLAGAFAFIFSRQYGFDVWPTLGTVLLSSFGGAKVIEAAIERYLPHRLSGSGADPA